MLESAPTSVRRVRLLSAQERNRIVQAQLIRDFPAEKLELIEIEWADTRQQAANAEQALGLAPLEHAHWDWRNKRESIKTGRHMAIVVECEGDIQGAMAIFRTPKPSRLGTGHVVYIDYLESAPWNLKAFSSEPRFLGVGTVLVADAIRLSLEMQLGGAVGLHSLPQAERFYSERCRMVSAGADANYFDLTYFEFSPEAAIGWLASVGEYP